MDPNLQYLIDRARQHEVTPAEREAQVRSFAYGNAHVEDQSVTKADIDRAITTLKAERESESVRP